MEYVILLILIFGVIFFINHERGKVNSGGSGFFSNGNGLDDNSEPNNDKRRNSNPIPPITKYKNQVMSLAKRAAKKHAKQLAIERRKAMVYDPYGKQDFTQWEKKGRAYFIDQYIFNKVSKNHELNSYELYDAFNEIYRRVEEVVEEIAANTEIPELDFNIEMTGIQFESFCEQKLIKEGWVVTRTKGSGDQGIDLIIKKGKRNIGVQCKKFSKPVGNKAIQEVKAGISHYNLSEGIVLTNNTFTKSAIQLAGTNGIKLYHFLETESI